MKDLVSINSSLSGALKGMRSFNIIWKGPVGGSLCQQTCPAGVDVPRYIRLISEKKFDDALAVIKESIPFLKVVGRVCHHPCEAKCQRNEVDESVAINSLKRYVADTVSSPKPKEVFRNRSSGKSVAIVGSGPAGLTAAYYLTKCGGYSVTVFEALPKPGGMMRVGIPDFRLPKNILDAEIQEIQNIGVDIKLNTQIKSIDNLLAEEGYNAVFIATGAHRGLKMEIEGKDINGVLDGIEFLRDVNLGKRIHLRGKVAVIGGGNVAIDSARTAIRLGSKEVIVVYRRSKEEMPAAPHEVEEAIYEGVKIFFLTAPTSIQKINDKLKLACRRMELGDPDASGRRVPIPIQGSDYSLDFDSLICAVGSLPFIPDDFNLKINRENVLQVDPDTLATEKRGIFAGGDLVTGPASVIWAIVAGKRAAVSIDKYLGGNGAIKENLAPRRLPVSTRWEEGILDIPRTKMPLLAKSKRKNSFNEVEPGLSSKMASAEARRCLKCGLRSQVRVNIDQCRSCSTCQMICSLTYKGEFNPSKANIVIEPNKIFFKESCIGGCSLCIDYCPYGVFEKLS